jgi:transcriptional regulator with XRE-family HTH domain
MVFADKLQSLRKSKGLSQEELAEKCSVSQRPLFSFI